jgi:cyclohexadienyl dehydratase
VLDFAILSGLTVCRRAPRRLTFPLLFVALGLAAGCAGPGVATRTKAPTRAHAPAGSLRVGTSGNYPPFSTWKGDHAEDFAAALLEAFAADQRIPMAWTRFRWPDLVSDLRAGRFDLAADGITVRPERSVAGRFTVPVARGGAVLLLRRPSWMGAGDVATIAALDRPALRVAVNRGGHLERVARRLLPSARILAIAENAEVREALARGEADSAMTNTFEAPRWAQGLEGVEAVGPLTRDIVALYVRADEPDLAARLDTWLLEQEQSGALGRLRARHLGGGGPTALPLDALLSATAERLSLMPFVALAKQRAGKAVEDPAQEARVIEAARSLVLQASAIRGAKPPPVDAIDAFFRAQMEVAKAVQQRARPDASAPVLSLEDDLRPAIARITARMAFLLARLPRGLTPEAVATKARDELSECELGTEAIARLSEAIAAVGG